MGTPDFAVPSLDILVKSGYDIVAVITATDKMGGRGGKKLIESPIKNYAVANKIKVLQPKNLKSAEFLQSLKSLKADLQIVVAFRMLPEVVWNMPPKGTYNLHGSLLPKYRGAAPIHWAVINGDNETGVTTFKLKHEIDTGDILLQEAFTIQDYDTTGTVHNKMMHVGAKVLLESVQLIERDELNFRPQDQNLVSKAPKIYSQDAEINEDMNATDAYNLIRGMNPFPTAWTILNNKKLKVYQSDLVLKEGNEFNSFFDSNNKDYLRMNFKDGYLELKIIQMEGKRKMNITEFLNGYDLTPKQS